VNDCDIGTLLAQQAVKCSGLLRTGPASIADVWQVIKAHAGIAVVARWSSTESDHVVVPAHSKFTEEKPGVSLNATDVREPAQVKDSHWLEHSET
jgi:hypothetical protein